MADLKTRIVRRVRDCNDEELHQKLIELYSYRRKSLPKVRTGADGSLEVDAESFLGIMQGEGRAAGARANQIASELATDVSQFGEDEKRVSDWLFQNCDSVLDDIESGKELDAYLDLPRRRRKLLIIFSVSGLIALLNYFILRTYLLNSLRQSLLISGALFLAVLGLTLEIWKRTVIAKGRRRCELQREVLRLLKESLALLDANSNETAQEKADAAFKLAKRDPGNIPWGFCFDVLGQVRLAVKNMHESLNYLQQALEIAQIEKDNTAEFSALTGLAKWHLAKGDAEAAATTFRKAHEVAQRDNFSEFLERSKQNLRSV